MKNKRINLEFDTNRASSGDSQCPRCGSKSVTKGVNGNIWVLYNKGTQNLHNCTGASNPWSNYTDL